MRPAWSVLLLTTLIGAGQGLFLALVGVEASLAAGAIADPGRSFFVGGSVLSAALVAAGLVASFFHLGRPSRAWRSATMWRTSWLSREVIALPAFLAAVTAYGAAHWLGSPWTFAIGALGVALCLALFVCTAMIYACLRFLQEWHTPLTLVNYVVLGCASGTTLATALAAFTNPALVTPLAIAAAALALTGLATRIASLRRNRRLRPRSTVQSATGIPNPKLVQKSQGFMGSSFATREFFHGRTREAVRAIKWFFLVFAFPVPVLLLALGAGAGQPSVLAGAFVLQWAGLLAERWYFFAEARHPQNLYYQSMA